MFNVDNEQMLGTFGGWLSLIKKAFLLAVLSGFIGWFIGVATTTASCS